MRPYISNVGRGYYKIVRVISDRNGWKMQYLNIDNGVLSWEDGHSVGPAGGTLIKGIAKARWIFEKVKEEEDEIA